MAGRSRPPTERSIFERALGPRAVSSVVIPSDLIGGFVIDLGEHSSDQIEERSERHAHMHSVLGRHPRLFFGFAAIAVHHSYFNIGRSTAYCCQ
jgi:hypothetical protein